MNEQRTGSGAQQVAIAIEIAKVSADRNDTYFQKV